MGLELGGGGVGCRAWLCPPNALGWSCSHCTGQATWESGLGTAARWVRQAGPWGLPLAQALEALSAGIPAAKMRRSAEPGLLFLIKMIT